MFPFACKQNMNLRPIEQIRFPRKRNTLFTENPIFENYVEFCRQNNANSQAVCHIPYKNIAHTAQPTTPPCPTFRPVRRSAASRSRLRRCGGVRKRERAACFSFRFLSIIFYIFNAAYFLSPTLFVRLRRAAASDIALRCESASRKNSADAPLCGVSAREKVFRKQTAKKNLRP